MARALAEEADGSVDACLLGPLYQLPERADRLAAIGEGGQVADLVHPPNFPGTRCPASGRPLGSIADVGACRPVTGVRRSESTHAAATDGPPPPEQQRGRRVSDRFQRSRVPVLPTVLALVRLMKVVTAYWHETAELPRPGEAA